MPYLGFLFDNIIMAYYERSTGEIDAVVSDWPSLNYFSSSIPDFKLALSEDIFDFQNGQYVFYLQKNSPYTSLIYIFRIPDLIVLPNILRPS